MKSLFLGIAFMLSSVNGISSSETNRMEEDFTCNSWATFVVAKCGAKFYLCEDNRSLENLYAAASHFGDLKC